MRSALNRALARSPDLGAAAGTVRPFADPGVRTMPVGLRQGRIDGMATARRATTATSARGACRGGVAARR